MQWGQHIRQRSPYIRQWVEGSSGEVSLPWLRLSSGPLPAGQTNTKLSYIDYSMFASLLAARCLSEAPALQCHSMSRNRQGQYIIGLSKWKFCWSLHCIPNPRHIHSGNCERDLGQEAFSLVFANPRLAGHMQVTDRCCRLHPKP